MSGTRELDARPGLADLMARIRANGVRLVLVERADRLARDLTVSELLLAEFRRHGVSVVAADSGTDLSVDDDGDPTRTLIRQVLGAGAEFERSVLVAKVRKRRKPSGTRPGEADGLALIRELRQKRCDGKRRSFVAIADELNARGIPTRNGGP